MKRGVGIGIIVVSWFWILSRLNWGGVAESLQTLRWGFWLPSTLLGAGVYALLAYRWTRLLGNRPRFSDTFSAFMVGVYANTLLPLRMGDVARSYLIHRRVPDLPMLMILVSLGTGLLFDMLSLSLLLPLALLLFPLPEGVALGGVLISLVSVALLLWGLFWVRRGGLPPKSWLGQFQAGLAVLLDGRESLRLLALTLLAYGGQGLANAWLLWSLQPDLPLLAGYVVMVGAALGFALPLLPGSVGTYESAVALTLSGVGMTPEDAVVATLFFRLQYNALILLMGGAASLREGLSLDELRQLNRSQSSSLGLS